VRQLQGKKGGSERVLNSAGELPPLQKLKKASRIVIVHTNSRGLNMRIYGLHKNIYTLSQYTLSQEKLESYRKRYEKSVKLWERAKLEGCEDDFCQEISKISRSTYFRYKKILKQLSKGILPPTKRPKTRRKPSWGEAEIQLVLRIRRAEPSYGKDKIGRILRRDHGSKLSDSTVGRILKHLQKKGLIQKSISALRIKRKRNFTKGHAKSWQYKDYDKMVIGERVQIDHMTVTKNNITVKHFRAWERRSKYIDAKLYGNAKSTSARKFLLDFVANAPFKVLSIQVDGGSEFMAEFEDACAELNLPLDVLPPASPKYNGGVERGNRTFREEFYARKDLLADSIGALRAELTKALHKYNTYRPHFSLKGFTPMEYINNNYLEAAA